MPRPTLSDDGAVVTLDLHGATVDDALRIAQAAVAESARRGRTSLRIVHGTSTTDPRGGSRTIKSALREALDRGAWAGHVVSSFPMETVLLLGLAPHPRPLRTPLRLSDLTR